MGLTPSQDWDVDYTFRYTDLDAAIDGYDFTLGRPADQLGRENRSNVFLNRVQTRLMTLDNLWEHVVGFSLANYDRRDTLPGPFDVPAFRGQSRKVDYQGNLAVAEWNTFSIGADYLAEDSQTSFVPTQNDKGLWLQDQVRLGDQWFTTVGFRWDEYSRAGPADTYRLTTLYRLPSTKTAFHASLGTAFRAPSLAELDYGPNLRPERSKGWDVGLQQPLLDGSLVLDGTYFRNDFTDLIQFDFTTFTLENVGRALSSGVEFTADWAVHDCTALFGSYVYTFTEDLATGLPLLRRAPHKARFGIRRRMLEGRGQVLLDCLYVGPREDVGQYPARTTLSEYWLVNLAGTYDLTERIQLVARVDNLLNEKYQEVYGYGAPWLSFFGGGNLRW
jgi:vitamin B12 transporter